MLWQSNPPCGNRDEPTVLVGSPSTPSCRCSCIVFHRRLLWVRLKRTGGGYRLLREVGIERGVEWTTSCFQLYSSVCCGLLFNGRLYQRPICACVLNTLSLFWLVSSSWGLFDAISYSRTVVAWGQRMEKTLPELSLSLWAVKLRFTVKNQAEKVNICTFKCIMPGQALQPLPSCKNSLSALTSLGNSIPPKQLAPKDCWTETHTNKPQNLGKWLGSEVHMLRESLRSDIEVSQSREMDTLLKIAFGDSSLARTTICTRVILLKRGWCELLIMILTYKICKAVHSLMSMHSSLWNECVIDIFMLDPVQLLFDRELK